MPEEINKLIEQRDAARDKVRSLHKELAKANAEIARLEREQVVLARKATPLWRRVFS